MYVLGVCVCVCLRQASEFHPCDRDLNSCKHSVSSVVSMRRRSESQPLLCCINSETLRAAAKQKNSAGPNQPDQSRSPPPHRVLAQSALSAQMWKLSLLKQITSQSFFSWVMLHNQRQMEGNDYYVTQRYVFWCRISFGFYCHEQPLIPLFRRHKKWCYDVGCYWECFMVVMVVSADWSQTQSSSVTGCIRLLPQHYVPHLVQTDKLKCPVSRTVKRWGV